ncbi:MAG: mannose-1-phosphate guanylyltransferase, partial [Prevotellaceae bacterium]|nr:mannose-1-phosphate guanylyltransferase [Prevotellaceae bacterium]
MQNSVYAVIMAGGIGSRFWPLSRNAKPKQFLDILGVGRTFIQQTFDRLTQLIPPENVVVVTSSSYKALVMEQLPLVRECNVLLEPLRRNTAPCIAYATYKLLAREKNATVVVAPSDHLILNEEKFIDTVACAMRAAEADKSLVTIGIKPTRPETGYGYIQVAESVEVAKSKAVCKVKTFTEKPDLEMAKVFVSSGEFFWNSGIFAWTLQAIREAFAAYLPEVGKLFEGGAGAYYTPAEEPFISNAYAECKSVSIDYGVMEKAENVHVVCADFGWSDLGTWTSLYLQAEQDSCGNALQVGSAVLDNVHGCLVRTSAEKLVLLQDLSDYLVVDSDNVLMVCRRSNEGNLKQL